MNKDFARQLSNEIKEALAGIEARHNVQVTVRGGSFSSSSVTLKVEFAKIDSTGVAETPEREAFKRMSAVYGLLPTDLDREIKYDGRFFKIVGLKPTSRRCPIVALRDDGRRFRLPASEVALKLQALRG